MNKSEILYEESGYDEKYVIVKLLLLVVGLFLILFPIFYIVLTREGDSEHVLRNAFVASLMLAAKSGFLCYIIMMIVSIKLTIYDQGIKISGFFPMRDRFIPFSEIDEIRPYYFNNQNNPKHVGFLLVLKSGGEKYLTSGINTEQLYAREDGISKLMENTDLSIGDPIIRTVWGKERAFLTHGYIEGITKEKVLEMKKRVESLKGVLIYSFGVVLLISMFIFLMMGRVDVIYILTGPVGIILMAAGFYIHYRKMKDLNLLRRTIEYELKNDVRVLPEEIDEIKPLFARIYRDKPGFSKEKWKKLLKYKTIDPIKLMFSFFPFMYSIFGTLIATMFLPVHGYMRVVIVMIPFFVWKSYLFRRLYYGNIYRAVKDYERWSGEVAIPYPLEHQ